MPNDAIDSNVVELPDDVGKPYDEQLVSYDATVLIVYDAFVICASLVPKFGACVPKVFLPLLFSKISFSLQLLLRL